MQTFLPHPNFAVTATMLDRARLGKQRVEAKQIYLALTEGGWWKNHPAVQMWRGYESGLAEYGWWICSEWIARGYRDSLASLFDVRRDWIPRLPDWIGDEAFHASHRSNLLRKNPLWYSQFGWKESPFLPYVWPKGAAA